MARRISSTTALAGYRNNPNEIARTRDLMDFVTRNLSAVLGIGVCYPHLRRTVCSTTAFTRSGSRSALTKFQNTNNRSRWKTVRVRT
jgi:hypothetical protein